jgi:hypothetical protein
VVTVEISKWTSRKRYGFSLKVLKNLINNYEKILKNSRFTYRNDKFSDVFIMKTTNLELRDDPNALPVVAADPDLLLNK